MNIDFLKHLRCFIEFQISVVLKYMAIIAQNMEEKEMEIKCCECLEAVNVETTGLGCKPLSYDFQLGLRLFASRGVNFCRHLRSSELGARVCYYLLLGRGRGCWSLFYIANSPPAL